MKAIKSFVLLFLAAGFLGLSGCATMFRDSTQTAKLRVRVLVDGADTIHVQGDRLWLVHYAYELPGRWRGGNQPTIINGQEWYPDWKGDESSVFTGIEPDPLPKESIDVSLDVMSSTWGEVTVWQQPRPDNDYTLIISIDDRGPKGAHWYTIDIDW